MFVDDCELLSMRIVEDPVEILGIVILLAGVLVPMVGIMLVVGLVLVVGVMLVVVCMLVVVSALMVLSLVVMLVSKVDGAGV